jgi:sigma-B regulation protein RsbU (phosphoserine phosphatase)
VTRALDGDAGLPLGILEPSDVPSQRVTLGLKDTLVLYTDGIVEAFDHGREMFGVPRLDAALDACTGAPDCVIESLHRALFHHRGSPTRDDDQTLVAMRYHGVCAVPGVSPRAQVGVGAS